MWGPTMWSGLFFGLISLFTPQASLPDTQALQGELQQFAQYFQIDAQRVKFRDSLLKNPSPFLTYGGSKACVVHINHNDDAKRVWSHFVNAGAEGASQAFLAFSSGHELTHCMLAEPGRRASARQALEQQLGVMFSSNTQFEETLADLVGLAYVAKVMPEQYAAVLDRLRDIRQDFSASDPEHNSSNSLRGDHVAFAEQLVARSAAKGLQVAQAQP
ncbi:hypothetical protein NQT62_03555 [Limnobacter humi]|uniref:Peptidase M48 domain-containing protein n=1 Tax=Limnobacter humi TaxID=1778671 RepID=A0ABT1WDB8_9BURK|nr:hypothetical protein [Limnobacter humi]MCQ8895516.1 hypothetical protein [Limnobacter humi]